MIAETGRAGRTRRTASSESDAAPQVDGRTARARVTQARIVAAASELFIAGGYQATSIEAIAAAAGVGVQTVYHSFGTKRGILTAALDQAVAGDDEPAATLERPWATAALATANPAEQLRRQVDGAAAIYARAAALLDVVRGAAATDPDLAQTWRTNIEQRRTVQRTFAEALSRKTTLRAGITVDDAANIALAVLSPETYRLLTSVCGWSVDRWRRWAADALLRQLTDVTT